MHVSGRLEQSTTGHSFGTNIINVQKHAQDTSVLLFLQCWFDSVVEQVTFNKIVTVINPSGVLIPAVSFPMASTKHCAWQVSCRTWCIRSTTTLIISNANVRLHCHWDQASSSFVTFPSELDRIQCWTFWVESWFPKSSLNVRPIYFLFECLFRSLKWFKLSLVTFFHPSFATRLLNGPQTYSMSPSYTTLIHYDGDTFSYANTLSHSVAAWEGCWQLWKRLQLLQCLVVLSELGASIVGRQVRFKLGIEM